MRISFRTMLAAAAALMLLPLAAVTQSGAQDRLTVPAEQRQLPWRGELPVCESPAVLSDIQTRFAAREQGFWASPLRIVGYENVRHVALRPWGSAYIPRRFCSAVAHVDDGHRTTRRTVNYVIVEDLGFTGWGYGVQWCMTGVERHRHAAPDCRLMRP